MVVIARWIGSEKEPLSGPCDVAPQPVSCRQVVVVTTTVLQVKVKPRARSSSLVQSPDGTWLAQLRAPPIDGKANQELIALVARHFGCAKSAVVITSGASGKLKLVRVGV